MKASVVAPIHAPRSIGYLGALCVADAANCRKLSLSIPRQGVGYRLEFLYRLTSFGRRVVEHFIAGIFMKLAAWMRNWPLMPRPKGCPQCAAGIDERLSLTAEGSVRRRAASGIIVVLAVLLGLASIIGGTIFFFTILGDFRFDDFPLVGALMIMGAALVCLLGLYIVSWGINYMHYRPVVECYRCGWGDRAA